jgi:hypothetical protein
LAGAWIQTRAATEPANAHVNAAVCTCCQPGIAASYRKTGMGGSFAGANAENVPALRQTFHPKVSGCDSAVTGGSRCYLRRWQIGFDGKVINIDEAGGLRRWLGKPFADISPPHEPAHAFR